MPRLLPRRRRASMWYLIPIYDPMTQEALSLDRVVRSKWKLERQFNTSPIRRSRPEVSI